MAELPVLNQTHGRISEAQRARIAGDLAKISRGRVRFGLHDRLLYSTDASIYQVEPIGVVEPADIDDAQRIVAWCGHNRIPLLPRGGGTSLPGQCTNFAVVMDYSPTCRRTLGLDREERIVHVEPGITIDDLNRWLDSQKSGLFFAPDPATSAQAAIGGCIGNNAAGARSIRYGRTSENLAAVDVVLSTGQRTWLGPRAGRQSAIARKLAEGVANIVRRYADLIRQRFPKTLRRNAGYALDLILRQLDAGITIDDLDLTGLLCGSEGTLAVTLGAKLKLHPVPQSKGLAIASFRSVADAINAVAACVASGACAVELLDDVVLETARGNAQCRQYMRHLPKIDDELPAAVLYVEYQETAPIEAVHARFDNLKRLVPDAAIGTFVDPDSLNELWALRKAGEPLLHGLAGHRKPITCVEDNAVPLENLAKFVDGFRAIVARHGTKAAYYAHASVGVLHVRPLIDLHDPADRDRMRAIAIEVADLARERGGIMSGEHGDGRLRGPLLERYFGPDLMRAFGEVKALFDPPGVLNPGMIIGIGPVESITDHLRVKPNHRPLAIPQADTYFDYSSQEGFAGAVEMCNGAGVCRRLAGGVMCPSYRATMDERHSTRGRGNALRMAISGQALGSGPTGQPVWDDPETIETLSLCLSCKACKSECPSNVDIAKLKAEYAAQRYKKTGHTPLQARIFGHIRTLNRLGSIAPSISNWISSRRPIRSMLNHLLGLARQRSLPPFSKSLYRWFRKRGTGFQPVSSSSGLRIILFADCFTTYNEPRIGHAAVRVLEKLGYRVELPKVSCCGRSMISMGLLEDAIRSADRVVAQLRPFIEADDVKAILVAEPSCLAAMRDEYLSLKLKTPMSIRKALATKAIMIEEFVEKFWNEHPIRPQLKPMQGNHPDIVFHGHCHQKAIWGEELTASALRRVAGAKLTVLPSGCCGMAGSFGYTTDRYDVSLKIGEQSLFSLLRQSDDRALIVAPGTSCRHQIKDGIGRRALHPVEFLAQYLT